MFKVDENSWHKQREERVVERTWRYTGTRRRSDIVADVWDSGESKCI